MFKRREGPCPSGQGLSAQAGLPAGEAGKMPNVFFVGVFLFLLIGLGAGFAGQAEAGLANHVVINEVSIDSVAGTGGSDDDWVELYNPTDAVVDFTGWSLQKATSTGGVSLKVALSKTIVAKGYFLIVKNGAKPALKNLADLVISGSFDLSDSNSIILANKNVIITDPADLSIVDYVGWDKAALYEGGAAAPAIPEAKSIARVPDGEDTNQNSVDFQIQDLPSPTNSHPPSDDDLGGTVLLTITPDAVPAQNINSTDAQIVFQVNSVGTALVKYGLSTAYASTTAAEAVAANTTKTISLTGLACAKTYHYVIYAENTGGAENDTTGDASFTTLPCGITLDSLTMTKASAKADNQYATGWQWEFNITVWNMNEKSLKMKFNQWSGAAVLDAGANMQYSADNGAAWHEITANAAYPAVGADLTGIDNGAAAGRQVKILVRMKVPVGTAAGYYSSSYGILTE